MKLPIYLDYSATCPVDHRVAKKMLGCLTTDGIFGSSASRSHRYGWQAEEAIDIARENVANLLNAAPREIIFTSGATESNNLAIKGSAHVHGERSGRPHLITCKTEHKAVLDTCSQLEREGYEVTYLKPKKNGLIDIRELEGAIRENTILVSIMHVNNEIGVIQDIATIGELCRSNKVIFHVDAAQSVGKIPIDVKEMKVDLLSISAHKIYGPKGIGALYVCHQPHTLLEAQIHGGGHERGLRSGTLATHQVVGMGEACRIAKYSMHYDYAHITRLRDKFLDNLRSLETITVNGDLKHRIPHSLNISFGFVDGESLLILLKDLAVSSGSACNSASLEPSYVLRELGLCDRLAHSSIRFSFGRNTTEEEIDFASEQVLTTIDKLHSMRHPL